MRIVTLSVGRGVHGRKLMECVRSRGTVNLHYCRICLDKPGKQITRIILCQQEIYILTDRNNPSISLSEVF